MKTVILAGGFGTRLSEKTGSIPKPMVPVGEKPILWQYQLLLGMRYGRVEAFPTFARKVNEVSFGLEEQLLFVLGEICIEQLRFQAVILCIVCISGNNIPVQE